MEKKRFYNPDLLLDEDFPKFIGQFKKELMDWLDKRVQHAFKSYFENYGPILYKVKKRLEIHMVPGDGWDGFDSHLKIDKKYDLLELLENELTNWEWDPIETRFEDEDYRDQKRFLKKLGEIFDEIMGDE